jgi:hypothetical protein
MNPRPLALASRFIVPLALWMSVNAATPGGADKGQAPPAQAVDPAADLAAKLEKHRKKYGADLHYEIDPTLKMVFVIGTDPRSLAEVKQRLTAHAEALRRDLFRHGRQDYLSVVVPRKWANPKVTGHFYPDFIDAATIGSSLMHEFTHALHYADQVGRAVYHPVWIMEGLATLYEESEVVDGHAVPKASGRLRHLQQEVREKKHLPFARMMTLERRQFTSRHYAQAGAMCLYFHATGNLPKWYAAYTEGAAEEPSGIAATGKIYGKPLEQVENDWAAWLLGLDVPRVVDGPEAAGLGLGTRQLPDGLEIILLAPDGAAAKAGLAAGDALIRVDGKRVIEPDDLKAAVAARQPGDTVAVEYRRNGEYHETAATLTLLSRILASPPGSAPAGPGAQ